MVKTGLQIAIPPGTYARVAPRSGLAVKHFIDTGAGVVDEDYRGEVGVVLFNHADTAFQGEPWTFRGTSSVGSLCRQPRARVQPYASRSRRLPTRSRLPAHSCCSCAVRRGDRVAQLILERIVTPDVVEVLGLDETARGADGFGSTG